VTLLRPPPTKLAATLRAATATAPHVVATAAATAVTTADEAWSVDVPVRLRARACSGRGDVVLELLRINVGRELPEGTPLRGSTRTGPGNGATGPGYKPSRRRRALAAVLNVGETAVVLAAVGAASPNVGATISTSLAVAGAVRAGLVLSGGASHGETATPFQSLKPPQLRLCP
jgi:hypothetical protein